MRRFDGLPLVDVLCPIIDWFDARTDVIWKEKGPASPWMSRMCFSSAFFVWCRLVRCAWAAAWLITESRPWTAYHIRQTLMTN